MADSPSQHKEKGETGKICSTASRREEPLLSECTAQVICNKDLPPKEAVAPHQALPVGNAPHVSEDKLNAHTPVKSTKETEDPQKSPQRPVVLDSNQKLESSGNQVEVVLSEVSDESKMTDAAVTQAKDPPEMSKVAENSKPEETGYSAGEKKSQCVEGSSGVQLSPGVHLDDTAGTLSEPQVVSKEVAVDGVTAKSHKPTKSDGAVECQDSVKDSSEPPCSSKVGSSSTETLPVREADTSSLLSDAPEHKLSRNQDCLLDSSKRSICPTPEADGTGENSSTLSSTISSESDMCPQGDVLAPGKVVASGDVATGGDVVVPPHPSPSISRSSEQPPEGDASDLGSGSNMELSGNQSQGRETAELHPPSKSSSQQECFSVESESQDRVSGAGDLDGGKNTDSVGKVTENEVAGSSGNLMSENEMQVNEPGENWNDENFTCETNNTDSLPMIVATRSLCQEEREQDEDTRVKREPAAKEEGSTEKPVPSLESEPLKPVTIGSSLQPLEEVQEASVLGNQSFASDIAIMDSSADEADSIGGLVINNVIGAADGVADFHPDEVEAERELTDISASAPQLGEGGESCDEHAPSAKRRRLENGSIGVDDKSQSAKKVIIKVTPVKNGHGIWDSQKLQEVLLSKGTILLQIHASRESMELFELEKSDQKIDFTAIMSDAKDDDHEHILSYGNIDSEGDSYDPLAVGSSESSSQPPSFGRTFSQPRGRSTALQPAMSRPAPAFKHLQFVNNYYMKNEVLAQPQPLEFEEPQGSSADYSGMDIPAVATLPDSEDSSLSSLEENDSPSPRLDSDKSRTKVCPECGKIIKIQCYKMHLRLHSPLLECDSCPFKTRDPMELNLHKFNHGKDSPDIKCYICHKYYKSQITLKGHNKKMHNMHSCKYCNVVCYSAEELRIHLRNKHGHSYTRERKYHMDQRKAKQVPINTRSIDKPDSVKIDLTCQFCQKVSRNKYQLKIHLAQHLGITSSEISDEQLLDMEVEALQKQRKKCDVSGESQNLKVENEIKVSSGDPYNPAVKCEVTLSEGAAETQRKIEVMPAFFSSTKQPSPAPSITAAQTVLICNPIGHSVSMDGLHGTLQFPPLSTSQEVPTGTSYIHSSPLSISVSQSSTLPMDTGQVQKSVCVTPSTSSVNVGELRKSNENKFIPAQRKGLDVQSPKKCSVYWCEYCTLAFPTPAEVYRHSLEAHPKQPIPRVPLHKAPIPLTTKKIAMKPALPKKVRVKLELPCDVCGETYSTSKALIKHKKLKHGRTFICPACHVVHKSSHRLIRHQKTYHKDKYRCRYVCGVLFDTNAELVSHYKDVHSKDHTKTHCPYCQKAFIYEASLFNHLEKCNQCPPDKRPAHVCGSCEGFFINIEAYNNHIKSCIPTQKKKNKGQSSSINLTCENDKSLIKENANVSTVPESPAEIKNVTEGVAEDTKFSFDWDSMSSSNMSNITEETKPSTSGNVKCKYCPTLFIDKDKAVQHILSMHKHLITRMTTMPQMCEVCGMMFKNAVCLCKHLLRHFIQLGMWDALVPRDILNIVHVKSYCWICKTTIRVPKNSYHVAKRNLAIDRGLELEGEEQSGALKTEAFNCEKCEMVFSTRKDFWNHVKNHLSNLPRGTYPHYRMQTDGTGQTLHCSECDQKYERKDELYEHLAEHFIEVIKDEIKTEKPDEESSSSGTVVEIEDTDAMEEDGRAKK